MHFFKEHLCILKIAGPWLFLSFLGYSLLDESLSARIQASLNSPSGIGPELWIFGFLSLALGILIPCFNIAHTIGSILKARGATQNHFVFFAQKFPELIKENMRSWGSAMTWGLIFIIPGFIRFFQLYFVPYIVLTDSAYEKGQIDALYESKTRVAQIITKLSVVVFIFDFLLPLITHGFFDESRGFLSNPISASVLLVIDIIFFVFSVQVCLKLFENTRSPELSPKGPAI